MPTDGIAPCGPQSNKIFAPGVFDGREAIAITVGPYSAFGQAEIPQDIYEVDLDPYNGDVPQVEYDYRLMYFSSRALSPKQFDAPSYLCAQSQIRATYKGVRVVVAGYRSNMSLADQIQRAYVEQEALNHSTPAAGANRAGIYLLAAFALIAAAAFVRYRLRRA